MTALCAFLAGLSIVFLVQTATGLVADRSWAVVAIQPLIATAWVAGTTSVVRGWLPCVAYIAGSTLGSAGAMWVRKRRER